ncbi:MULTISPECIES: leishmanolysin [unclassified Anaeromyxobacter]|uniref:leishmanolysin n=1 Tax=unclassified Anaeromyxobacter TaxID=2620896 RepID=UPI001F57206A|nr:MULTISPECIES: leishmanolysin [unclassified Anaeromyxobacter]
MKLVRISSTLAVCAALWACSSKKAAPEAPAAVKLVSALPASVSNGAPLEPAPAVRLVAATGSAVRRRGVTVSIAIVGGEATLRGTASATTDVEGVARFPGLSLVGRAGPLALEFSSPGLGVAESGLQLTPGVAVAAQAVSGTHQTALELTEVAVAPSIEVRDSGGNRVPGAAVTFAVIAGAGSVSGAATATGDDGVARVQRWVLGNAGPQRLEARVDGVSAAVAFEATASPAPVAVTVTTSLSAAQVRVVLSPAPVVALVNASGTSTPAAGLPITVSLVGGGSLEGTTTQLTDAAGRVEFPDLMLTGRATGARQLAFSSPNLTAATLAVTVAPGPAASVAAASTVDQSAGASQGVEAPPAVLVMDLDGNTVPGAPVQFGVVSGGGRVLGGAQVSDADGVARAAGWVLGASGAQEVAGKLRDVTGSDSAAFRATFRDPGERYDVRMRLLSPVNDALFALLDRARVRVEQVVRGELSNIWLSTAPLYYCGNVGMAETIDDLLVLVEIAPVDGWGGILAQAGPCFIRTSNRLPVMGILQLDSDDLQTMTEDEIRTVMTHELLHVLGFGTMWQDPYVRLLASAGTSNPFFVGAGAQSGFVDEGGWNYSGFPVPVESLGGAGTADSHWRMSVFGEELMIGWLVSGAQALSRTTVMSLGDLGYQVDATRADPFRIASAARRATPDRGRGIGADVMPIEPVEVDDGPTRRR